VKIHEYQAKKLLTEYGIPVPRGDVAGSQEDACRIAGEIGKKVVIKSQVHAGGRGKVGGIEVASFPEEAKRIAGGLIGRRLVTAQTGSTGLPVGSVLVEEAVEIERELYLGIAIDPTIRMPAIIASEAGGMEIEEIARSNPEMILRSYVEPAIGFYPYQAREIAFGMHMKGEQFESAVAVIKAMYRLYWEKDCSLVEINPLSITTGGRLLALDVKINIDDNALFRHPEIARFRDPTQEDPLEVEARCKGIENYVRLEGDIGIVVNGAGLAMAVMDAIQLAGGRPANFLDMGTVNRYDRVVNAFKILSSDPGLKVVLVNIFGGMARLDVIAYGLVEAVKELGENMPSTVVRLVGTNLSEGEKILAESGIEFIRAVTFKDAVEKAVAIAGGNNIRG